MIVGLSGRKYVGKTTIAEHINNLIIPYNHYVMSFATPLKRCLSELTGLPLEIFTDKEHKDDLIQIMGITVRELMETFATDFIRERVDEDFWVRRMYASLTQAKYLTTHLVLIDDVRFQNEAEFIRGMGGCIIKLVRDTDTPPTPEQLKVLPRSERGFPKELIHNTITLKEGQIQEGVQEVINKINKFFNINTPIYR